MTAFVGQVHAQDAVCSLTSSAATAVRWLKSRLITFSVKMRISFNLCPCFGDVVGDFVSNVFNSGDLCNEAEKDK